MELVTRNGDVRYGIMKDESLNRCIDRYHKYKDKYDRCGVKCSEIRDIIETAVEQSQVLAGDRIPIGRMYEALFCAIGNAYEVGYARGFDKAVRKSRERRRALEHPEI